MATTVTTPKTPHVREQRRRRPVRRALQGLTAVLTVALTASMMQLVAERHNAAAHPAPGEHVQLADGRAVHVQVAGREHGGPTVVLEGGAGASSAAWAWVQPALARHTTVVSYDRAGLGWSDGNPHAADTDAVVADLHETLTRLALPHPYVLVGHSLGGHYVRAYTATHGSDVGGVVLVDPSHEESAAVTGPIEDMRAMFTALRLATRLGITRLYDPLAADLHLLPEPQRSQGLTQQHSRAGIDAQIDELLAVDTVGARIPGGQALGTRPLEVLLATGGAADASQQATIDAMADLRRNLTTLSAHSRTTIVPDASHVSILTDRQHAEVVSQAILRVVKAVPAHNE